MRQLTGLIVFGIAIVFAMPASAQLTGLDGGDTSSTKGRQDVDNINPTQPKTVNVRDNGRDIQIVVGRDGSIEVKVTRKYEAGRIAELADKYPELAEALDNFPRKLGSHNVDLSIGLSSSVKAKSLLALKEKSAAAFAVYKKYHDHNQRKNDAVDDLLNDGDAIGSVNNGSGPPRSYSARSKRRNLPKPNVGTISNSKDGMEESDDIGDLLGKDFEVDKDEKDDKKNSRKRRDKDDK